MSTLYVESVPEDVYDALRNQAKEHKSSIAAEVVQLLTKFIPTEAELSQRRQLLNLSRALTGAAPETEGTFASAEEMIREDRSR